MDRILKAALFTPAGIDHNETDGKPSVIWGLPAIWWDEPGTGKSTRIKAICRSWGLRCVTRSVAYLDPTALGGIPVPSGDRLKLLIDEIFMKLVDAGGGVLFLDEFSQATKAVQGATLRTTLERSIGDIQLPGRVRVLLAANPTEQAAGGHDLAPPPANRLLHLGPEPINQERWMEYMTSCGGDGLFDGSVASAEAEERRVLDAWSEAYAKARGVIVGYIRSCRGNLQKMPKAGSPQLSRGWSSARSNEMAARILAAAVVHNLSEIERDMMLHGAIGPDAVTLATWERDASLPDVVKLLEGQIKWKPDRTRVDRTAAVLTSCAALLMDTSIKNRNAKATRFWKLLNDVIDQGVGDIAYPAGRAVAGKAGLGVHVIPEAVEPLSRMNSLIREADKHGL